MELIFYSDPEKQKKLESAINAGLIKRELCPDGMYKYIITAVGMAHWVFERQRGR